ncbi:MAG: hypothetical protein ACU85V_06625 [Gammaproteobacteria bacterium]
MSAPFLSSAWYRVAGLRPRLHHHVRIHRQRLRGEAWYVLHDRSAGRSHRFTPSTYALINLMDGTRTVDEIWTEAATALGDAAPSQDDFIRLLHRLHAADVLRSGVPPDAGELEQRRRKQARSLWLRNLMNPMAFRIPLWDPEAFLKRTWPWVRRVLGWPAAVVWLVVVVWACALAALNWGALTENLADRVLAVHNLVALWLIYPVVKFCHELAHGYAVKSGGGEVHEMGLMFLVLAPVPYVDASASSAFRSKRRRMLVGGAGMLVEVFLAALAMFVWVMSEPGLVRACAFNVMLIGGFSTVAFNGNPLLRFDGYYIFGDLIEVANLGQRSNAYWAYLVKRYAFGKHDAESPAHTAGERRWFLFYAPVSWLYRLSVMIAIALFVASRFFFIGVMLGLWSVASMLVVPVVKSLGAVVAGADLDRHRRRAVGVTAIALGGAVAFATLAPVPAWTNARGVVWVPENAEVRPGAAGFVRRVLAAPGRAVARGEPLVELQDQELLAQLAAARARTDQLAVEHAAQMFDDRLQATLTREALEAERALVQRLEARVADLVVSAGRGGEWVVPSAVDLEGRYLRQGSLLGYVLDGASRTVRVVVTQDDVDRVRGRTRAVNVKLPDRPGQTLSARLVREVPGGSETLPTPALALEHGGTIATDPRDPEGLRTLERTFQFDIEIDQALTDLPVGGRAYVRFEHEDEPLAVQVFRRVRQLFLSHFNV